MARFSAGVAGGAPVRATCDEFKLLVRECHKRGIEVRKRGRVGSACGCSAPRGHVYGRGCSHLLSCALLPGPCLLWVDLPPLTMEGSCGLQEPSRVCRASVPLPYVYAQKGCTWFQLPLPPESDPHAVRHPCHGSRRDMLTSEHVNHVTLFSSMTSARRCSWTWCSTTRRRATTGGPPSALGG